MLFLQVDSNQKKMVRLARIELSWSFVWLLFQFLRARCREDGGLAERLSTNFSWVPQPADRKLVQQQTAAEVKRPGHATQA